MVSFGWFKNFYHHDSRMQVLWNVLDHLKPLIWSITLSFSIGILIQNNKGSTITCGLNYSVVLNHLLVPNNINMKDSIGTWYSKFQTKTCFQIIENQSPRKSPLQQQLKIQLLLTQLLKNQHWPQTNNDQLKCILVIHQCTMLMWSLVIILLKIKSLIINDTKNLFKKHFTNY